MHPNTHFTHNKQNLTPNIPITYPSSHIKPNNLPSSSPHDTQLRSMYQAIYKNTSSTSPPTQYHPFAQELQKHYPHLTLPEIIEQCERQNIYYMQDLQRVLEGEVLRKKVDLGEELLSQLGELKVEEVAALLDAGDDLNSQQYKILSLLLPEDAEEIDSTVLFEAYQVYREEHQLHNTERSLLETNYHHLREQILSMKGISHQLPAMIKRQSINGRIKFKSLGIIFPQLSPSQHNTIFKYVHYQQTHQPMILVDKSKTICSGMLSCSFLPTTSTQPSTQRCSSRTGMAENQRIIQSMGRQKQVMLQQLMRKNKEIERLNKIILLQNEQLQEQKYLCEQQIKMEKEASTRKYETVIEQLKHNNQQQKSMILWYQQQLSSISHRINSDTIMMENCTRDMGYWCQHIKKLNS